MLNIILIFLIQILLFTPQQSFEDQITLQNSDSTNTPSGLTHTLSNFQVTSGPNRLLLVGITTTGSSIVLPNIVTVTFGDQILTEEETITTGVQRVSIYSLVNPDVETNDIVVTTSTLAVASIGAIYLTNVETSDPIPVTNTNSGTNSSPTLSITTTSERMLILDTLGLTATGTNPSADSSQTEQWNLEVSSPAHAGTGSTKTIANPSTISMDWTLSSSQSWIIAGVAVREELVARPADSVSISDSVSTSINRVASPADSVSISDGVTTSVNRMVSISEGVAIGDSISVFKNSIQISLSESISISDSLSFDQSTNSPSKEKEKSNKNKSGSGRTGVNTQSLDDEHICKYSSSKNSDGCSSVPNYMRDVAAWWLDGHISDVEIKNAFRFLIDNDIIVIDTSGFSKNMLEEIPNNVKLIAKLWTENKLSHSNFEKIIMNFFGN